MPYDLFISYAHRDNARGQVRELRDAISEDFQKFAGRNLTIFFDEHDIPSMADWEKRIAQGLRESRLFLAVLSPNYFASAYCRREWEEYVRYEAMRQCLGEGVAPVYFIELPGLDGPGVEQSIAAAVDEMRKRQWCDLATQKPIKIVPWHDAGKRALEDVEVARRLKALKEQMAERLKRADRAQQSPTNLYRHNPQFVGRVRELTLLREALNERGSVGVVGHETPTSGGATAVHGLGGMGKTELALAYAHAFAWDYPGGRWLARCEGLDNFDLVLRQLAEPLHVEFTEDEKKDAHRAGERILAELRRRERSLLLLDNVTHAELLSPDVHMRLPPQGHIHLLATTRLGPAQLAGSPHDHTFVAVDELPAADALALIRAHQPAARFDSADDETAARELVTTLAGFTLAVETAAIYLARHAAPGAIAAYTERLRSELLAESEASAADRTVAVRHKEKLLERTLAVTFETLSAQQFHVLTLAALLPADQIALPWLRAVASETFPTLRPDSEADDATWQQLADSLLSLRLFQPGGDVHVVRMHRLVQELTLRVGEADRRQHGAQASSEAQSGQRSSLSQPLSLLWTGLLRHAVERAASLSFGWQESSRRWELPPLTAFGFFGLERIDAEVIEATIKTAHVHVCLGNFADAERLLRKSLTIAEQAGLVTSAKSAVYDSLSTCLRFMGRFAEADDLANRAVATAPAAQSVETAYDRFHALLTLAEAKAVAGDFAAAEQFYRKIVAGIAPNGVANTPQFQTALRNPSLAPRSADDHRAVGALFLVDPERSPFLLGSVLNNLGEILRRTSRFREAEEAFQQSLVVMRVIYGESHPQVATTYNNLGELNRMAGIPAEAVKFYRRALAIDRECLGGRHLSVARDIGNLALALEDLRQTAEVEGHHREALEIREERLGKEHPDVAIALNNLGAFLWATKRPDEAEPLLRRALQINQTSLPEDHEEVAGCMNNLANALADLGRLAEAEPIMRKQLQVLARCGRKNGFEHPHFQAAQRNYGWLLNEMGVERSEILRRIRTAIDTA